MTKSKYDVTFGSKLLHRRWAMSPEKTMNVEKRMLLSRQIQFSLLLSFCLFHSLPFLDEHIFNATFKLLCCMISLITVIFCFMVLQHAFAFCQFNWKGKGSLMSRMKTHYTAFSLVIKLTIQRFICVLTTSLELRKGL